MFDVMWFIMVQWCRLDCLAYLMDWFALWFLVCCLGSCVVFLLVGAF